MSALGHQWLIDGRDFGPPTNWQDFEIQGTFAQENDDSLIPENQPNLSIDRLIWSDRAAEYISNRFRRGLNGGPGAFQGVPVSWTIQNSSGSYRVFTGYIDFTKDYRESQFKGPNRTLPNLVTVTIVDDFGLNALLDAVNGVTMDLIADEFTDSDWTDIDFVVIKKFDFIEFILLFISIYIVTKALADAIKDLNSLLTRFPTTGIIAVAKWILELVLLLAYIALLATQLIALIPQVLNLIFSKKRTHKGVSLRKLLEKGFEFLGYTLVSPIEELDNYTILPTLPTAKSNFFEEIFNKVRVTESGLPSINDWGFLFTENLTTCRRLFNARLAVFDNAGTKEVHLRTDGDDWWFRNSGLRLMDNILVDEVGYNTDELSLNRYMRFLVDETEEWSREEKKGLSFEVITRSSPGYNDGGIPLEKGLDEIVIPYALGSRKGSLTALEELALTLAQVTQDAINTLGANINLTQGIQGRTKFLKISQPEISIAKLLYIDGRGLPANHRELLSAKTLQEKYHRTKSFTNYSDQQPFNNQYQTFEDVEIQFDLEQFLILRQNAYFITPDGESGRIDDFKWNPSKDKGTFNGRVRSVYDKSLTEETFELKNKEDD